jgi:hypothetical protein
MASSNSSLTKFWCGTYLEEFLFVNGTKFCIAFLDILAINMEVKHKMTSSYHPQCNGLNEQFTSTLYTLLEKNGRYDEYWHTILRSILFAYYTSISYMAESLDCPWCLPTPTPQWNILWISISTWISYWHIKNSWPPTHVTTSLELNAYSKKVMTKMPNL